MALTYGRAPGESCQGCGRANVPVCRIVIGDPQQGQALLVCLECIAEAIEALTGWAMQKTMRHWLTVSDISRRWHDVGQSTKRARRSKLA